MSELTPFITRSDKTRTSISDVGVHWHVDHALKVILLVADALKKSNPNNYRPEANLLKLYVFSNGSIPRGKGYAPDFVVASGKIKLQDLREQLAKAKKVIAEIEALPPQSYFEHAYFGPLDLAFSIRFLEIHVEHHLKIIRDIIAV